jgi:type II secretory pathway pseudopilin PulG
MTLLETVIAAAILAGVLAAVLRLSSYLGLTRSAANQSSATEKVENDIRGYVSSYLNAFFECAANGVPNGFFPSCPTAVPPTGWPWCPGGNLPSAGQFCTTAVTSFSLFWPTLGVQTGSAVTLKLVRSGADLPSFPSSAQGGIDLYNAAQTRCLNQQTFLGEGPNNIMPIEGGPSGSGTPVGIYFCLNASLPAPLNTDDIQLTRQMLGEFRFSVFDITTMSPLHCADLLNPIYRCPVNPQKPPPVGTLLYYTLYLEGMTPQGPKIETISGSFFSNSNG